MFIGQTVFILQNVFQSLLITAEKPVLSLKISVAAGLTNVIFDFLFIIVFHWGLSGEYPSAHLLFKIQYQPALVDENRFLWENASPNLHKRFI